MPATLWKTHNNHGIIWRINTPQLVTIGRAALWLENPLNPRLKFQGRLPYETVRDAHCRA